MFIASSDFVSTTLLACSVVEVVGLATERSQVRVPAAPLHVATLGKLFTHTRVPLFTKQYKLVPAKGGDALRLGR